MNKKRTQCEQNVNIRFGTRASALVTSFSKIIAKRCHAVLKVGAPRRAISVIFYAFVESGKQHLDCAGAVGMGSGPLVFTCGAYTCAICFSTFVCCRWG